VKYTYVPKGVCSREIELEIEEGIITSLTVIGGCDGNLQGIAKLVKGMKVEEVIRRLKGIDCHGKGTSCPDQIAKALESLFCDAGIA